MSPRHFPTVIASAVLFVAATGAAQAQDEGVKQIEQLIKRAKSQVEAISDAKQQLQKTMTAYNAVLAPDVKDRRDAYKSLQKEMATSEKKRAEVSTRSMELNAEADKLFKSWEASTAAIQSTELRDRSQKRLKRTQDRFVDLRKTGQNAADMYLADHEDAAGPGDVSRSRFECRVGDEPEIGCGQTERAGEGPVRGHRSGHGGGEREYRQAERGIGRTDPREYLPMSLE